MARTFKGSIKLDIRDSKPDREAFLDTDDKAAGSADFRTQSGHYAICGDGLCIGYESADPVSRCRGGTR